MVPLYNRSLALARTRTRKDNRQDSVLLPVLTQSSTVSVLLKGAISAVDADGLAMYE